MMFVRLQKSPEMIKRDSHPDLFTLCRDSKICVSFRYNPFSHWETFPLSPAEKIDKKNLGKPR